LVKITTFSEVASLFLLINFKIFFIYPGISVASDGVYLLFLSGCTGMLFLNCKYYHFLIGNISFRIVYYEISVCWW